MPPFRFAPKGNTLIEYGVVGSLVLLATIGTIMIVGGNLNDWIAGLKTDMKQRTMAAANQSQIIQRAKQAALQASTAHQQPSVLGTASAHLEPGILAPMEKPVAAPQTVGSNGTDILAQGIDAKALASLKSGQITQDEYNLIQQVSNKGHDIAALQGILAAASMKANGNAAVYNSPIYTYKGQNYTGSQLSSILQSTVTDFQSLQKQAEAKEDVIRSIDLLVALQESGGQILNNGWDSINNTQTADKAVYIGTVQASQGYDMGSAQTHKDSGTICTAGTLSDTGTKCNP